jgi:hypothetical protein
MPNNELLELARISLLNAGAQSIRYDATEDARMSYEVFAKNGRVVVIQGRFPDAGFAILTLFDKPEDPEEHVAAAIAYLNGSRT